MCAWLNFKKQKRVYCKFKACLGLWSLCTHAGSPIHTCSCDGVFLDSLVMLCAPLFFLFAVFWPLDEGQALSVIIGASSVRATCLGPCTGRLFVWLLSFLSCHCLLSDTCMPADTGASWARVFSPFPVYSMSPYRRFDIPFVIRPNLTSLALALGTAYKGSPCFECTSPNSVPLHHGATRTTPYVCSPG